MKNFVKKSAKFLSVNVVLHVFATVGSAQCWLHNGNWNFWII